MDHDQINAHLDKHLPADAKAALSLTGSGVQLCPIFTAVRPILVAVSSIPLLPKRWRDALATFVRVLDAVCPEAQLA